MRWRGIFKGLSQDGGRVDFYNNLGASLFNKCLSKEPNFARIHSAGQTFNLLIQLIDMTKKVNVMVLSLIFNTIL
jgi:hypothetical protein